jgi:hypothetical protein
MVGKSEGRNPKEARNSKPENLEWASASQTGALWLKGRSTTLAAHLFGFRPSDFFRFSSFGLRVCAGEAGCHAGENPAGRIGLFTTESWVREEAVRPNPKARPRLNCPVATTVNLIE